MRSPDPLTRVGTGQFAESPATVLAQVGDMMRNMELEADRVREQIEAALLDTSFSPSPKT